MSHKTPTKQNRKTPKKSDDMEIEDPPTSENIIIPEKLSMSFGNFDKQSVAKEYFEFEPKKFFDDCYNSLADYGTMALEDIENAFKRKYHSEADMVSISQSMSKASSLFQRAMDTSFDAFELYVPNNVFALPKGFQGLIKNHKSHQDQIEDQNLTDEIARLRSEINKERKNNLTLKSENAVLRKELDLFERNRYTFDALDKFCNESQQGGNIKELVSTLLTESTKLNESLHDASVEERSNKKPNGDELHAFAGKLK